MTHDRAARIIIQPRNDDAKRRPAMPCRHRWNQQWLSGSDRRIHARSQDRKDELPLVYDPAFWQPPAVFCAFTITYHYLFPQLTMGLAWFIVYWKWQALRTGDEKYARAARFWAKIFGLNFGVGVVTGIPMEFQFGTNWSAFSKYAGGVIGQTLAMEVACSPFFLEMPHCGGA